MPRLSTASYIRVLSTIPRPIKSVYRFNLCRNFNKSFGLLFGGTIDKTLIRYRFSIGQIRFTGFALLLFAGNYAIYVISKKWLQVVLMVSKHNSESMDLSPEEAY